jgi:penicillin-binding protein 1A
VLGTGEVSVLDMAAAFSTFANRGVRIDPRAILKIETAGGTVIEDNEKPDRTRVLDEQDADVVNFCLRQVVERGSGTAAQVAGKSIIGKTGTTQAFGDAWFVGATRKLTTAVWMGYPEGNSRKMESVRGQEVTGGSIPALIFKRFMTAAAGKAEPFPTPTDFGGRILNTRIPYVTPAVTVTTSAVRPGSTTTPKSSPASTAPAATVPAAPPTTAAPPPTTAQQSPPTTNRPPRTSPVNPGG